MLNGVVGAQIVKERLTKKNRMIIKEMMMMVDHGVLEADKINHAKMKMDMGGGKTMEHDDPNSVLLEPGKSGEIVWKFSKAGTFEIACNVPGHYDAGMVGELTVK